MAEFFALPAQSHALQQENLPPPANILVGDTAELLGAKRKAGKEYLAMVELKRNKFEVGVTLDDVMNASSYVTACTVAELLPKIAQSVPQQQEILGAIQNLGTELRDELGQIRRDGVNNSKRSYNVTAVFDNDDIQTPLMYDQAGVLIPAPAEVPATLGELRALAGASLAATVAYLDLPAAGTADERRRKVKRAYGIGVQVKIE